MLSLLELIHLLLPLLGFLFLSLSLKAKRPNYLTLALWLNLLAIFLNYQASGGEILGNYFNYRHAAIYSFNLLSLSACLLALLWQQQKSRAYLSFFKKFATSTLTLAIFFIISNLWINAKFIEKKLSGTAILQVATFTKPGYCDYKYIFYKIAENKKVSYLCPNYYGFIPSVGQLAKAPSFMVKHLPASHQRALS